MIFNFGAYQLDTTTAELRCDGAPVALEPQVLAVLRLLIEQRHRLVGGKFEFQNCRAEDRDRLRQRRRIGLKNQGSREKGQRQPGGAWHVGKKREYH